MTEPIAALVQYGAIGAILIISLAALRVLYNERNEEARARVEDAKTYAQTLLTIQQRILEAVDKLAELYDDVKERDRRGGDR